MIRSGLAYPPEHVFGADVRNRNARTALGPAAARCCEGGVDGEELDGWRIHASRSRPVGPTLASRHNPRPAAGVGGRDDWRGGRSAAEDLGEHLRFADLRLFGRGEQRQGSSLASSCRWVSASDRVGRCNSMW